MENLFSWHKFCTIMPIILHSNSLTRKSGQNRNTMIVFSYHLQNCLWLTMTWLRHPRHWFKPRLETREAFWKMRTPFPERECMSKPKGKIVKEVWWSLWGLQFPVDELASSAARYQLWRSSKKTVHTLHRVSYYYGITFLGDEYLHRVSYYYGITISIKLSRWRIPV